HSSHENVGLQSLEKSEQTKYSIPSSCRKLEPNLGRKFWKLQQEKESTCMLKLQATRPSSCRKPNRPCALEAKLWISEEPIKPHLSSLKCIRSERFKLTEVKDTPVLESGQT